MTKTFKKYLAYSVISACCTYSASAYELKCPHSRDLTEEGENFTARIFTGILIGKGNISIKSIYPAKQGMQLGRQASATIMPEGDLNCTYNATNMFDKSFRGIVQLKSDNAAIRNKCTGATMASSPDAFDCKE